MFGAPGLLLPGRREGGYPARLGSGRRLAPSSQPKTAMTPKQFFDFAKKHKAEMVDLKFMDFLGSWQHCSYPIDTWDEGTFKEGVGFDGSSIRGWQGIHMSDMLAIPEAD